FQLLDDQNNRIPKDDPVTLEIRSSLLVVRAINAPTATAMLPDLQAALPILHKRAEVLAAAARAALPSDQHSFAGQIARGDLLFNEHDFDGALAAYQAAEKKAARGSDKRRAQHRIGITLLRMDRLTEAEPLLTRLSNSADGNKTSSALLGAVLFAKRQYK